LTVDTTATFNPDIGEIVEEAYERAGLEMRSGYDLRTARRSLNFLLLDWQNRGLNLWTVEEFATPISLTKGTATYDIASGTIGLLDVVIRTNAGNVSTQNDFLMSRISQPTYATIPNKLSQGQPIQYYFDRIEIDDYNASSNRLSTITLWPVPDETSKYEIRYWRVARMAPIGNAASSTSPVPARFLPCLVAGLAYQIATKRPEVSDRVPMLKQQYEELFREAADEDRVKTSARFVPGMTYYS
jgi:hypothetical protein|tara:strand:- start:15112 stop:15840 length:729 start_codon:yes stop_codon:yes gene_type:complete